MKQAAATAASLSDSLISTIGSIMNSEHPDVCLSVLSINETGSNRATEIMELVDCRIFKLSLSLTSIKSCTSFMNAKGDDGEKPQICSIYRAKDISQSSEYRAVPYKRLSEQFSLAYDAINEEKKFINFLDGADWPSEMEKTST